MTSSRYGTRHNFWNRRVDKLYSSSELWPANQLEISHLPSPISATKRMLLVLFISPTVFISAERRTPNAVSMDPPPSQSPNTPSRDRATLKDLLRSRQQSRNGVRGSPKSCLPCRERKVKCDNQLPCSTCRKRGHPDLCDYQGSTRSSLGTPRSTARSAARVRVGGRTPDLLRENRIADAAILDQTKGQAEEDPIPGPSVLVTADEDAVSSLRNASTTRDASDGLFLADTSVVNMARRRSIRSGDDPARQSAFETGILPLLGISKDENESMLSYQSLPSDHETVRLFEHFRRRVQPFHVIVYNLDAIEEKICRLINATNDGFGRNCPDSLEDSRWLSLLHAILAAGAQFSDMGLQQRTIVAQRHSMPLSHSHCIIRQTRC